MTTPPLSLPGCRVSALADTTVDAACHLDDLVQVVGWPEVTGCAVDDALEAVDVLAVALARLGPEAAQALAPVRDAVDRVRGHLGIRPAEDEVSAVEEGGATGGGEERAADEEPAVGEAPVAGVDESAMPVRPVQCAARPVRRGLGPVGREVLERQMGSRERYPGSAIR